jgi:hypothetical protein
MDITQMSAREALAVLRLRLADDTVAIEMIDVIDLELQDDYVVPKPVFVALKVAFPKAGNKTFAAVQRRCSFCWRVWQSKYGPLNQMQSEYAAGLMKWCCDNSQGNYAFLYTNFDQVVNHERTDLGFKRRADDAEEHVRFDLLEVLT